MARLGLVGGVAADRRVTVTSTSTFAGTLSYRMALADLPTLFVRQSLNPGSCFQA